jgi:integrase
MLTLQALTTDYLKLVSAKKHSAEWHDNATRVLTKEVLPQFGHLPPEELTPRQIAIFIAGIVEEGKPAKANHTLIALRNVYGWAFQTGRLDCANPARDIKRQPLKPRERVLTPAELRTLWLGADDG